ncbi:MAG: hypothetical protein GY822_18595, partial [Deltaproteobacteria bacterium]|nr:hypothetical protein [Deltaproteobacteria bacterium]
MSDIKSTAALELPEWVDEEIFTAFLLGLQDSLDEIEATTFALGDAPAEKLDAIKRVVHTLKGEAYVVGIDEVGDATHELENHLEAQDSPLDCEEGLLCLVDWARKALESLKSRQRPDPIGDDFFGNGIVVEQDRKEEVILLNGDLKKQESSPIDAGESDRIEAAAEEQVRQALAPAEKEAEEKIRLALLDEASEAETSEPKASEPSVEDENVALEAGKSEENVKSDPTPYEILEIKAEPFEHEMHEIVEEFTQESEESLSAARDVLSKGESSGRVEHDDVNALFRVFHTIKGVAGFLDLKEIQELAHVTESVLIPCRDDGQALSGDLLTLISDATYVMADLSDDVKGVLCGQRDSYRIGVGVLFRLKRALGVLESGSKTAPAEQEQEQEQEQTPNVVAAQGAASADNDFEKTKPQAAQATESTAEP